MKFSIMDFFSKHDQIRRKLGIWSHLLKKSVMENFIFVQWKVFDIIDYAVLWKELANHGIKNVSLA